MFDLFGITISWWMVWAVLSLLMIGYDSLCLFGDKRHRQDPHQWLHLVLVDTVPPLRAYYWLTDLSETDWFGSLWAPFAILLGFVIPVALWVGMLWLGFQYLAWWQLWFYGAIYFVVEATVEMSGSKRGLVPCLRQDSPFIVAIAALWGVSMAALPFLGPEKGDFHNHYI